MLHTNASWNKETFFNTVSSIMQENTERRDLETFAVYGAFHKWKAEDTNFRDLVSALLADNENKRAVSTDYAQLVLGVSSLWYSYCRTTGIDVKLATDVAQKYCARELAKIANWTSKN